MPGYAIVLGNCYCCNDLFGFNPLRVPSYAGEPICEPCINLINERRVAQGREPFTVFADSYAPVDAGQL